MLYYSIIHYSIVYDVILYIVWFYSSGGDIVDARIEPPMKAAFLRGRQY